MIFILIFILGLSLLYLLGRDFRITERLAMAMPMGLGCTSCLMFILDRTTHSITAGSVTVIVILFAVLFAGVRLLIDWRAGDLPWTRPRPQLDFSWFTLIWVVFAGMTAYLVYGITMKCLFWPPAEFDTILGYDLLSKAIAREHVIANSLLLNKNIVDGCGTRLLYPPLLALCNSLCYMTGMETPKLINALFYVSWIFIFYALLRRFVTSTNAIIFTFLTVIIPEMFAHGSFSLTNIPCAIYTTIGIVSFVIWFEQKREGFFYLSLFGMVFSLWTRSEAIVFLGPVFLILLYIAIRERRYKYLLIYATALIPFEIWNIFLKAYVPHEQSSFFEPHLFYDSVKLNKIITTAWELMTRADLYGVTFELFVVVVLVHLVINIIRDFQRNKWVLAGLVLWIILTAVVGLNIFSIVLLAALLFAGRYFNQEPWALLAIFLMALGAYTAIYYQVSNADPTLFQPGGWMQSGYKRGLFCYAPLALFYVASSRWVDWAFRQLDERLVIFPKKA